MRILVVEDNQDNRDMLVRRLERRGYEVCTAENGKEGIESAHAFAPDVILMDLSLPVMSGLEATRALRAQAATREIKIIALTAHAMAGARRDCMQAGVNAFATKPIEFDDLIATLEAVARGDVIREVA